MGTKHGPDFDRDYRWNSFAPHLLTVTQPSLTVTTRTGGCPRDPRAAKEHRKPTNVGNPHPTRQSFGTTRRVR